ncbi:hypothetical protein HDU67_001076, partial [Dinochytrium kinnereticum]
MLGFLLCNAILIATLITSPILAQPDASPPPISGGCFVILSDPAPTPIATVKSIRECLNLCSAAPAPAPGRAFRSYGVEQPFNSSPKATEGSCYCISNEKRDVSFACPTCDFEPSGVGLCGVRRGDQLSLWLYSLPETVELSSDK